MEPEQPSANNPSEPPQPPGPPGQIAPVAVPVYVQGPQPKTSGMAIASLVLGIVGTVTCVATFGIASIVGLILGIVSLGQIKRSVGELTGRGLAIAGIVLSAISLALAVLSILFFVLTAGIGAITAFRSIGFAAEDAVHMSNMRQVCVAAVMYADDNGSLPDPDNWKEHLESYLSGHPDEVLDSPYEDVVGCGFAMNGLLVDSSEGQRVPIKMEKIVDPGKTVLFFEAENNSPPAGGRELLPEEPRGPKGYLIGFIDGHVENLQEDDLDDLRWAPEAFENIYGD